MTTALTLRGASFGTTLAPQLFRDIDFDDLNLLIQTLADNSKNLDKDEKISAIQVIDTWQEKVINRLRDKSQEMYQFLRFFTIANDIGYFDYDEEKLETFGADVANKTNSRYEYDVLMAFIKNLNKLQQTRPEQPYDDLEKTRIQNLKAQSDYKLELAKYNNKVSKAQREVFRAHNAWMKIVLENEGVKDTIKRAKHFTINLKDFTSACVDKADVAKMNVAISDEETRRALHGLLDFSLTI